MLEKQIAHAAIDLWNQDLPPKVLHLLKRNLIDSFAGICASLLDFPMIRKMKRYQALAPDPNGVTVWGVGERAQLLQAVFLNTILGRRSDLVNTYLSPDRMGGNHPSDNVSFVLTLAESKNLSGKEVFRALHTVYVLSCAFSDYYNPEAGGYDHDATASFYTALLAGLLQGLDESGLVQCQRIAGAMGLNPDQTGLGRVTDWKHCTYASCAMRGVEAALLAKAGFQGPVDIYRGRAGWNRFLPHAPDFMTKPPDLGRIVFKSWQALVFCQTVIDAAVLLSPEFSKRDWRKIKSIRIETYEKALLEAGGDSAFKPATRAGRTHSLPYCLLAGLIRGGVDYDSFSGPFAKDQRMTALMDKVILTADAKMTAAYPTKAPCKITLDYEDGPPLSVFRKQPKGDPADPLSDEEISAKAGAYLSKLIPADNCHRFIERMWSLEKEKNLIRFLIPLHKGVSHV